MQLAGHGLVLGGGGGKLPRHLTEVHVPVGALQLLVGMHVVLTAPIVLVAHSVLHVPPNSVPLQLWGQEVALLGGAGKAAAPHVTAKQWQQQYHCRTG